MSVDIAALRRRVLGEHPPVAWYPLGEEELLAILAALERAERVEAAVRDVIDGINGHIRQGAAPTLRQIRWWGGHLQFALDSEAPLPGPQTGEACAMCGKNPADGLATIGDKRYCHGEARPSCYERASWAQSVERGRETLARRALPGPGREDGE